MYFISVLGHSLVSMSSKSSASRSELSSSSAKSFSLGTFGDGAFVTRGATACWVRTARRGVVSFTGSARGGVRSAPVAADLTAGSGSVFTDVEGAVFLVFVFSFAGEFVSRLATVAGPGSKREIAKTATSATIIAIPPNAAAGIAHPENAARSFSIHEDAATSSNGISNTGVASGSNSSFF